MSELTELRSGQLGGGSGAALTEAIVIFAEIAGADVIFTDQGLMELAVIEEAREARWARLIFTEIALPLPPLLPSLPLTLLLHKGPI